MFSRFFTARIVVVFLAGMLAALALLVGVGFATGALAVYNQHHFGGVGVDFGYEWRNDLAGTGFYINN